MTNEKQLIDVKPLMKNGWHLVRTGESNIFLASMSLADVPVVDAVEVVHGHMRHVFYSYQKDHYECTCCNGTFLTENAKY